MGGELTPEDVPAVEAFANHISIALENARLFDALRLSENVATKFQEKLRILHEVNFELTGIESLDELYQAVVETGLQRLRFERLALFLIEEDGKFLRGTYGTDETGHIRDEKHVREEINETKNKHLLDCLRSRTRSTHLESVALHGAGQELDKKGWNALAIVWDGINAIGMLATDNYLTQLPPQPYMEDLLSIYGNIVGHLIARIRNEQAMRESEQRYRALFEESPISIWEEDFSPVKRRIDALRAQGVKDFQSYFDSHPQEVTECAEMVRIVDVNKAALKIYRAGKKEDLLKSLRQALDMESLAGFQEELVAIANGKTVLYRECSDKTLTGEQIDVSLSWLVAPGYENDFARVIVSVVDITERKRAEIEREKLIADLEMKNAELERFVYTLSHDLKSPLVTINGFLGYLKQDAVSGNLERFHQDAQRIQSAADTMQRLLGELIELSRVGQFVYGPETVPFNDLVHKALALLPGHLESREITVRTHPNLPAVYGDKQRLVEVLQNLLDNAVKYMGGQVEPVIEIGITGYDNSNDPIFFVRDNGIGIPPEYHDHVFGIFNKLDPHTEGTGVGLSLVKRIIEVHRGRIWVESEAGKGSTFFFTLPATPPG
jgi:signal transduction histidine kinase